MSEINGKVIITTGASSSLGKATAQRLAGRGAKLVLAARREERLLELRDAIRDQGGDAIYHVTDVTERNQVESMISAAKETYGRIDLLINNAGLMPLSPLDDLKVDE